MRVKAQAGFTIVELMVTLLIGLVIIFAAAGALENYQRTTYKVADRTDNSQKARFAMDLVVRNLRSQACASSSGTSLLAGTGVNKVVYVTDLSDGSSAPEKRILTFEPTTGVLSEQRFKGTLNAATQTTTFAAAPFATEQLLDGVSPATGTGLFSYFGYAAASGSEPAKPTTPLGAGGTLSSAELGSVGSLRVGLKRGARSGARNPTAAITLSEDIAMRSLDPSTAIPVPVCA